MNYLQLNTKHLTMKVQEAVALVERIRPDNVVVLSHEYTISTKEGPSKDIKVKVAFKNSKVQEAAYVLTWDERREQFRHPVMLYRNLCNYRIVNRFDVLNPYTDYVNEGYAGFAIAHLLKELGFRKESKYYYIKGKGRKPEKFKMRMDNHWHLQHTDFNGFHWYQPSMGNTWTTPWGGIGIPEFQPCDYEGYICTVPTWEQMAEFCSRWNITLRDINSTQTVIEDLVRAYRQRPKQENAFRKYMRRN